MSKRARRSNTLGTRISSLQENLEGLQAVSRTPADDGSEARIAELERQMELLLSANYRLEEEYPDLDERYLPSDTGWLDMSSYLLSGYTAAPFSGRKVGNRVYFRGFVSGTFNSATTLTVFTSALPADWLPSEFEFGSSYFTGYSGVVAMRSTTGTLEVGNRTGTGWTSARFSLHYLAGT